MTFLITAMYWGSLWKYCSRAYRYCLLNAGHLLAKRVTLAVLQAGPKPADPGQTSADLSPP